MVVPAAEICGRVLKVSCNLALANSVVNIWDETCPYIRRQFVSPPPLKVVCCLLDILTSSFCSNRTSATAKGKAAHMQKDQKRTHNSSCTWVNVIARHLLICRRYRMNDGRVVTFTRAPGTHAGFARCRREMEVADMFMERPYLVLSLWKCEEIHFTWQHGSICLCFVCEYLDMLTKAREGSTACRCSFIRPRCVFLLPRHSLCVLEPTPSRWKSVTVMIDCETASADNSLFTSSTNLASVLPYLHPPPLSSLSLFLSHKHPTVDKQF